MAEGKVLTGAGLRGQVAGKTALSTVGKSGAGLTYRGYDVQDLAENCQFEEVAYLIFFGELPTAEQLASYKAKLKSLRQLPQALKEVLERIPADSHPMDVMRTGVSMLGNLETEESFDQQQDIADRILATLPAIICYWYRYSHDGVRIEESTDDDSIGAQFLHLLHGKKPNELHEQVMNVSLILYAEHEFNASTFTARVCASTLSDMHSCITGAIGSLRGPLHGGANEAAMDMIETGSLQKKLSVRCWVCWNVKKKSWALVMPSIKITIRVMGLLKSGLSVLRKMSEILFYIRYRYVVKKSCGARKSYSVMRISSMPLLIILWVFQQSCLHRFL